MAKRNRERSKVEKREEKSEKRAARKEERRIERERLISLGIDPDLYVPEVDASAPGV